MGNKWFKLALVSFVGIIVSIFSLSVIQAYDNQPDHNSAANHQMDITKPLPAYNGTGQQSGVTGNGQHLPYGNFHGGSGYEPYNNMYYKDSLQYQLNIMRNQMSQIMFQMNLIMNNMSNTGNMNNLNYMNNMSNIGNMGNMNMTSGMNNMM